MDPIAYSPETAAFMAGCSLSSINRAIQRGELSSCKRGRRRFIRADDLDRWLSATDAEKAQSAQTAKDDPRALATADRAAESL